jgi:DNA-binding LacI/PurR family transcriptional regulator
MGKNTPASKRGTPGATPATSYDVARLARVSQSAVSRCYTPGASISAKTRAKIVKAATELGYRPNAIARGLITRRSNMVAVIITNLTNMVYPEVLFHLNQRLVERHIHLLLFTLSSERNVAQVLEEVWQYRVDGVVAAAQFTTEQIEECQARSLPIVFYNRSSDNPHAATVCCDHERGERELVDRLARSGHRHFAVVSGPRESEVSTLRTRGAIEAIERTKGLTYEMFEGDYTYKSGREAAGRIAALKKRPDAVICANDVLAIGCIDAFRHTHGLAVPADISVTGFDGVSSAEWSGYDLTTVVQPVERMVEAAVDMLLERIENPGLPAEARLFAGAVRLGSSARLRGETRGK